MGYPIAHSLSPVMFNAAFAELDMDWAYLAWRVKPGDLHAALEGARSMGLAGANLTIPLKEMALEWMDVLSPEARVIGAVNCVAVREDKLYGFNTDGEGFLSSLREDAGFEPRGKRVLVVGAGGAARAVAFALGRSGCGSLTVANRTVSRAESLAEHVREATGTVTAGIGLDGSVLGKAVAESELLVQTSPVGMYPEDIIPDWFDPGWLDPGSMLVDIIYRPRPTALLRKAAELGCSTLDGLGMLVHQAALGFEIWAGGKAPVKVMRDAAIDYLAEFK